MTKPPKSHQSSHIYYWNGEELYFFKDNGRDLWYCMPRSIDATFAWLCKEHKHLLYEEGFLW